MRDSDCVRIELPLEARVRLLRDDYAHFERNPAALFEQLDCLTVIHGRERIGQWKALATNSQWETMVESILREHYDPAYMRSITRNFERAHAALLVRIDSDAVADFAAAAQRLTEAR
jgi:tRNA 2-selenouridine synthase